VPTKPTSLLQQKLQQLGLHQPLDFALHLPLRYDDLTHLTPITDALHDTTVLVRGVVQQVQYRPHSRGMLTVTIADASGELNLTFFQTYASQKQRFERALKDNESVQVYGQVKRTMFDARMHHPKVEWLAAHDAALTDTLSPVYPTMAGLPQPYLAKAIARVVDQLRVPSIFPPAMEQAILSAGLPSLQDALRTLHRPPTDTPREALVTRQHPAWQRVKLEEILAQQLCYRQAMQQRAQYRALPCNPIAGQSATEQLITQLPFTLTESQRTVIQAITMDLQQPLPMLRLLQGDVGSGKTVVAAVATAFALGQRLLAQSKSQSTPNTQSMQLHQVAVMAPTEILAEQLFTHFKRWFEPLGLRVAWLAGKVSAKQKKQIYADLADGAMAIVVGTHALIQPDVQFKQLVLCIVDEQHRFGVAQRLTLLQDAQQSSTPHNNIQRNTATYPHLLMMSATPIPRSLAMTLYAGLAISTITHRPEGRSPITTRLLPQERRDELIDRVARLVESGQQVYWVCPLIQDAPEEDIQADESNAAIPHKKAVPTSTPKSIPQTPLLSAQTLHHQLQTSLPALRIGLLHGKLNNADKQAIMTQFREKTLDVLVATTVIEVGVDVPNATLMLIEHAERFGLAQLHQLRGRVGRGAAQSYCVLLYQSPLSAVAKQRLQLMRDSQDGFVIAEQDLALRGAGEFLGTQQSGEAMFRFVDLQQDQDLVEWANQLAKQLRDYPAVIEAHLNRWLRQRAKLLGA
jgi:ATP-dependent DNA helicase RecG